MWRIIICILISIIYNGYIFWRYKRIPVSLSETSYILGGFKRYWFTLYCSIIGTTLLPILIKATPENYEVIPLLICTGLLLAGVSPTFRQSGLERTVHYVSSFISFAGFILYTILCIDWVWLIGYGIILGSLCIWKKECYVWFAEILALIVILIDLIWKIG